MSKEVHCNWRLTLGITLLSIFLSFQSTDASNGKSDESSIPRSIKKIVLKYCDAVDGIAKKSALRMAVTPFISTRQVSNQNNDFGLYIAENSTAELINTSKNIRLIERTRLDAITKENALTLSGLISETDARKVGELLPIDYILTGTYTVLGSQVMINARMINVITGEIAFSKSDQIEIPDALREMFPEDKLLNQTAAAFVDGGNTKISMVDSCMQLKNAVLDKTGAAGPSQYNTVLIQEGMKIPFSIECGDVHFRIIDHFVKNRLNVKEYTNFLINCADTMINPFGDNRGGAILRYFAADTIINPDEWKAALIILSKIDYYRDITYLIRYQDIITDQQKERLIEIFKRGSEHKIGKRPVSTARLMEDVLEIMDVSYKNSFGTQNKRPDRPDSARYSSLINILDIADPFLGDSAPQMEAAVLLRAWEKSNDATVKEKAFLMFCQKIASVKVSGEKDLDIIMYSAKELHDNLFKDDTTILVEKNVNLQLMSVLGKSCEKMIKSYVNESNINSYRYQDLIPFCLFNGIEIKGIPSVDTLKYWLSGENSEKKNTACSYLKYMGKRAVPLESNIIRAIRKGINASPQPNFNKDLIISLGILKSNTPETRTLLMECLAKNDPGYISSNPIIYAVAQCGPSIIPLVKKYFLEDKWNRFYETCRLVSLMGMDAKDLFSDILSFGQTCGNAKYRLEAEETIDDVRNRK